MSSVRLLPGAIAAILADAAETKTLTESDRYGLMAAMLDEHLSEEDRKAIDRILHAVRRGRIQVL